MPNGTAKEWVIGGEQGIHLQGLCSGEMEGVEVFETELAQSETTVLDGGSQGLIG